MDKYSETDTPVQGYATENGYDIIMVPSSNGKKMYTVDLTLGRCSCPGWTMHANKDGSRNVCKHLRALGYKTIERTPEPMDIQEPTKVVGTVKLTETK